MIFLHFLFCFAGQKYVYLSVLSLDYITSSLNKYHFQSINLILTASDNTDQQKKLSENILETNTCFKTSKTC